MSKDALPKFYVSTYCNFPHRMRDGRPLRHECRMIPPAALRAERDGDYEKAIAIMQKAEAERRAEAKDRDIDLAHELNGLSEREMEFEEWCYCRTLVRRGFGYFLTPTGENRPRFFETR